MHKHFVTLTFSNESIIALSNEIGDNEANDIASLAVRRFTERWRKKYKKAPRHWLITELGHPNEKGKGKSTERLHNSDTFVILYLVRLACCFVFCIGSRNLKS